MHDVRLAIHHANLIRHEKFYAKPWRPRHQASDKTIRFKTSATTALLAKKKWSKCEAGKKSAQTMGMIR
jgi:hypothetical protein